MLIVWFDCNNGKFYLRFGQNYYDKYVGFKNSYGHEIVDMYGYDWNSRKWLKCDSYLDLISKKHKYKPTRKEVIKDRLISFINRF